MTFHLSIGL